MGPIYGFYLAFTLGCSYYVIAKHLENRWKNAADPDTLSSIISRHKIEKKAKVSAFIIIAIIFWWQDDYRHHLSPEAKATKALEDLVDGWESGQKGLVLKKLEELSVSRPWIEDDMTFADE